MRSMKLLEHELRFVISDVDSVDDISETNVEVDYDKEAEEEAKQVDKGKGKGKGDKSRGNEIGHDP